MSANGITLVGFAAVKALAHAHAAADGAAVNDSAQGPSATKPSMNTPTFHVLNLIARGVKTEKEIMSALACDRDGKAILAGDMRAPGRQIDTLQSMGFIDFVGDEAHMTDKARSVAFNVICPCHQPVLAPSPMAPPEVFPLQPSRMAQRGRVADSGQPSQARRLALDPRPAQGREATSGPNCTAESRVLLPFVPAAPATRGTRRQPRSTTMPGNRITLVGFAAAEALAHAAADRPPANDSAQGPVDTTDGDDGGDADDLDEAPLPEALLEALDAQALANIRSGSPHVDVESVPERPERVEGGWWVSMRIFVSDED
jgi:hypothetical protein